MLWQLIRVVVAFGLVGSADSLSLAMTEGRGCFNVAPVVKQFVRSLLARQDQQRDSDALGAPLLSSVQTPHNPGSPPLIPLRAAVVPALIRRANYPGPQKDDAFCRTTKSPLWQDGLNPSYEKGIYDHIEQYLGCARCQRFTLPGQPLPGQKNMRKRTDGYRFCSNCTRQVRQDDYFLQESKRQRQQRCIRALHGSLCLAVGLTLFILFSIYVAPNLGPECDDDENDDDCLPPYLGYRRLSFDSGPSPTRSHRMLREGKPTAWVADILAQAKMLRNSYISCVIFALVLRFLCRDNIEKLLN